MPTEIKVFSLGFNREAEIPDGWEPIGASYDGGYLLVVATHFYGHREDSLLQKEEKT